MAVTLDDQAHVVQTTEIIKLIGHPLAHMHVQPHSEMTVKRDCNLQPVHSYTHKESKFYDYYYSVVNIGTPVR